MKKHLDAFWLQSYIQYSRLNLCLIKTYKTIKANFLQQHLKKDLKEVFLLTVCFLVFTKSKLLPNHQDLKEVFALKVTSKKDLVLKSTKTFYSKQGGTTINAQRVSIYDYCKKIDYIILVKYYILKEIFIQTLLKFRAIKNYTTVCFLVFTKSLSATSLLKEVF